MATPAPTQQLAAPATWPLKTLVFAVLLVTLGGQLDVSWHRTIGRDSFFTPPHMMVYLCGLLAAIACAHLTFTARPETSVHVLGLRAPLGVLLTAWGGLVMLYSAPFDNWWHNAYGLDVQVASPPHILLLTGTWAVCQGVLLLAAAQMNRARTTGEPTRTSRHLFLLVGALAVIHLMSYSMTYTFDTRLHAWKPYFVLSTAVPFALAALAATLRRRWVATQVAALYTAFMAALVWLLPLIPATPHLGPVYQSVTHMVPPKFPILLLPAAFLLDLLFHHLQPTPTNSRLPPTATPDPGTPRPWLFAALAGPVWLLTLVAVEWPFASFLMSPWADNRFFATHMPDFGTPSNNPDVLRIFEAPQHGRPLFLGLLAAAAAATIAIRAGQAAGSWMRQVQR